MEIEEEIEGLNGLIIAVKDQGNIVGPFTGIPEQRIKKIMGALRRKQGLYDFFGEYLLWMHHHYPVNGSINRLSRGDTSGKEVALSDL
jgi:hypothetical protein